MIIWITGLPGSGKTTLAKKIESSLRTKVSNNIVHLDGDNIRKILPYKVSYSTEDRMKLALFYSELALLVEKSGCIVICSFVALFSSIHEHTRQNAINYFEIFLNPSLNELVKKNKKNLYRDNSEYMLEQLTKHEFPSNPELMIDTLVNGVYQVDLDEIIYKLLNKI